MQKITPFLWFDHQAEEAARFYVSLFKNSKMGAVHRIPDGRKGSKGKVMSVTFILEGQHFMALNGGPLYKFTEAISLFVSCKTQKEVDTLWKKLTSGGGYEQPCGWCKDKYGLSWQIIPKALGEALSNPDPAKAQRAVQAMLKMKKIVISDLKAAMKG
jgi:predicted 3-demethylubiquinone-9 3-methyltransferase (glyoxalase superfamily)